MVLGVASVKQCITLIREKSAFGLDPVPWSDSLGGGLIVSSGEDTQV